MRYIVVVLTIVVLAACAGSPTPIPEADSKDAKVYAVRCGSCHSVPDPRRHNLSEWSHMLDLMYMRISERNVEPLSDDDQKAIMAYLKRHAR